MPRLTADGNSNEFVIIGPFSYHMSDDFGTGTAVIQEKIDNNFVTLAGTSTTVAVDKLHDQPLEASAVFRLNLSSSSSPDLLFNFKGNVRIKGQS